MSKQLRHGRTVVDHLAPRARSRPADTSTTSTSSASGRSGRIVRELWRQREPAWRLLIRALVIVVFAWGIIGTNYKLQGALSLAAYPASLAIIYSLVLGYSNVFNFAWHAVIGLGSYAFAYAESQHHVGVLPATVWAVLFGAVAALVSTLPVTWLAGFQLALVTIAAGTVFGTALVAYPTVTGGSSGLLVSDRWVDFSPLDTRGMLELAVAVLAATGVVVRLTVAGRNGRKLCTVGDDEFLAATLGVSPVRMRLGTAAWAGALTGLVASFAVQHAQVAVPDAYALGLLIQVFLVLVVGGRRSIWGPAAASLVVVTVPAYIGGINGNVLTIVFGLLVIATVVVRPWGLYNEPLRDRSGVAALRRVRPRLAGVPRRRAHESNPHDFVGLEIHGLTKRFGAVVALENATLQIGAREVIGIVGSNGSGKTTLLNCLNGIWRPDAGAVRWVRRDGTTEKRNHVSTVGLARRGVGRSFQTPRTFEGLTLRDNLLVAADRTATGADPADVDRIIDRWNLNRWRDERTEVLPHGIKRWIELGRLDLANDNILLLDEPAAGLSEEEIEHLAQTICRWRDEGRCVVLVEHNHKLVREVCDRTVVMAGGQIVAVGELEEMRKRDDVRLVIGDRLD
jgi:branched-chain amino acid transport system permease protein